MNETYKSFVVMCFVSKWNKSGSQLVYIDFFSLKKQKTPRVFTDIA